MKLRFTKGNRTIVIDDKGMGINAILTTDRNQTDYPFISLVKNGIVKYFKTKWGGVVYTDGSSEEWSRTIIPSSQFLRNPNLAKFKSDRVINVFKLAFCRCENLTIVEMKNCKSIELSGFNSSKNLHTIIIPKCTEVGKYVFSGCTGLRKLVINENVNYGDNFKYIPYTNIFNQDETKKYNHSTKSWEAI